MSLYSEIVERAAEVTAFVLVVVSLATIAIMFLLLTGNLP